MSRKWRQAHHDFRVAEDILDAKPVWSREKPLRGVPNNDRVTDCIDAVYSLYHKSIVSSLPAEQAMKVQTCPYILDVSQTLTRKPFCDHIRSMCANSTYYVYGLQRAITPAEHLGLLGWPHDLNLAHLSHSQIRDLCGESMAMPCIALCACVLILSMQDKTVWEH